MSKKIHNAHDKFFRYAMSDIRVAREFFLQHLPSSIKERLDFNSLAFQKESFIDEELKTSAADVVYSANFKDEKGYIYTLVEHQSTVDRWIAFRLTRYMLRIMEHHHRQYPKANLPVVYPLVFYNGVMEYTDSTDFFDLFGEYKQLAKDVINRPFQLIDVKKVQDKDLRQYLWAGILEFVFKHRRARNFLVFAEQVMIWLHQLELEEGFDYAGTVIKYIIDGLEGKDVEILVATAKQHLSPQLGEETMTFADQLREQGYQRGIQEGIERGIQESIEKSKIFAEQLIEQGYEKGLQQGVQKGVRQGAQQALKQIASNLLEEGIAIKKIAEITGLTIQEIKRL